MKFTVMETEFSKPERKISNFLSKNRRKRSGEMVFFLLGLCRELTCVRLVCYYLFSIQTGGAWKMLLTVTTLVELDFSALMQVYAEGNAENGQELYPHLPAGQQILSAEQDFYSFLREVFFRTPNAVYKIWVENGRYVSALRLEPYRDGLLLEALETAPTHRRQGYAKQLLRETLNQMEQYTVYSHVSKKNEASLRTHLACGFQRIGEYAVYADGSVLHNSCTLLAKKTL